MTTKLVELKPCPFCGGFAGVIKDIYGIHYMIHCNNCDAKTKPFTQEEKAVEAWNSRAKVEDMPTADVVENKVLRLLLDWAIECGFGYDSIPEEYEKYKDDIQDKNYAEGLIYIAMKEVEDGKQK